ncbi:MAG: APC family permease [Anaerolineae bacterium]
MSTTTNETQRRGFSLGRLLFGDPLATHDLPHQAVSKPVGLAVFASDALSSTAYATEEILIILSMAGTGLAVLHISIPIAIAIAILLAIVTISYRQTIYTYPNGGGAYIVARDNLGELPAQIAGAALLTDYILTVAVSISSGVAQIASAFPNLNPYRVQIAVAVILVMMIVNLRGVKESGRIFAVPTYFFIGMMFLTLGVGFVRVLTGTLPTVAAVEVIEHDVVQPLTLFLILRAFSSGCAALTGIEAISNGITAFKEPRSRNAATTLVWMSSILITLFLGITFLANRIQAMPSETETVISQIARTIYGADNVLYFLTLAGTSLILLMAANTSYADFPRLAAIAASDGYLPRQLSFRGGRLVFSYGIVVLSLFAAALVILMRANTTALIPLYAIGVFLSFTLSQTGMVKHLWKRGHLKPGESVQGLETVLDYDPHWRKKMIISAIGALATFVVMMIFAITKFTSGAWFVILLIPALVLLFTRIHNHYQRVAAALSLNGGRHVFKEHNVQTIVLIDDVHKETAKIINFAMSLGHPWKAVHVSVNPEKTARVKEKWAQRIGQPDKLVILESPYRQLTEPIKQYLEELRREDPDGYIHVVMGHLAMDSYWEQALHQNSALIFNLSLSQMRNVAVTMIPFKI